MVSEFESFCLMRFVLLEYASGGSIVEAVADGFGKAFVFSISAVKATDKESKYEGF